MFDIRWRPPLAHVEEIATVNVLYGEIDVVAGGEADLLLVVTQKRGLAVQTKDGKMLFLPPETSLFCVIDGPPAAWIGAMKRLNQCHALIFDYGEEVYRMGAQLQKWFLDEQATLEASWMPTKAPEDPPF